MYAHLGKLAWEYGGLEEVSVMDTVRGVGSVSLRMAKVIRRGRTFYIPTNMDLSRIHLRPTSRTDLASYVFSYLFHNADSAFDDPGIGLVREFIGVECEAMRALKEMYPASFAAVGAPSELSP